MTEAITVSSTTMAQCLGITVQRLTQLERAGHVRKLERGRFDMADTFERYVRFQEERAARRSSPGENRLVEAKIAEVEARIAARDEKLMDIREAVACFELYRDLFSESLRGLPAQLTDEPAERARVAAIVASNVERLTAACDRAIHRLRTGRDE
jgi:uncharacterized coiled-coil protein SlyX